MYQMKDQPSLTLRPIGYFRSNTDYKYAVPRQGVMNPGHPGTIELLPGMGFELATPDLAGIERLWIIFHFHENTTWQPLARPPVAPPDRERIGVFATRSPYRPNPLGLGCVRLLRVEPLKLTVDETDMLDGTPILDIKPYIPKIDSFTDVDIGWIADQKADEWIVAESPLCHDQFAAILEWQGPDLAAIARVQLCENPFATSRKRVERDGSRGVLSVRMFRIRFIADAESRTITLESVHSGYSREELSDITTDPYEDKALHRALLARWPD